MSDVDRTESGKHRSDATLLDLLHVEGRKNHRRFTRDRDGTTYGVTVETNVLKRQVLQGRCMAQKIISDAALGNAN
jgi:hypothetical protein